MPAIFTSPHRLRHHLPFSLLGHASVSTTGQDKIMFGWTPLQRNAAIASFLSWALDAFDFFILVFSA
ncbi:hypothetical protein OS12_44680 [Dickeya oryzae]